MSEKNIKIVKAIVITLLILILCLIGFFASSTKSENSSKDTTSAEDKALLQEAIGNAGDVSDDKRKKPDSISVDEFIELYNSEGTYAVLFSKDSCKYCKIAVPILENIIYEDGVDLKLISLDDLTNEDKGQLLELDTYFTNGFGTPLLLAIGDKSIKDEIEGLVSKADYVEFFKEYKLIK